MNLENDNIALKIIDETIEEQSHPEEGFIIDNDAKAEWALRKVLEERAEAQRYINICQTMINEYQIKAQKAEEKLKNKTNFLELQLQKYFETVSYKETKTQKTYRLPSGTLKYKYLAPDFVRDENQLIIWLKQNSLNDFVKVEEKPNWAEFKKKIIVSGEVVVTEDGQIVEGVKVVEKPPMFEIEI